MLDCGTFAFIGSLNVDAAGHKNTSFCLFAGFIVTHPNGNLVLSGSEDNAIYFYDLNTQQASHRPLPSMCCLPAAHYKSWRCRIRPGFCLQLVQKIEGRSSPEEEGDGHCDLVLAVARHPTSNIIASGGLSKDCLIKIWEDTAAG